MLLGKQAIHSCRQVLTFTANVCNLHWYFISWKLKLRTKPKFQEPQAKLTYFLNSVHLKYKYATYTSTCMYKYQCLRKTLSNHFLFWNSDYHFQTYWCFHHVSESRAAQCVHNMYKFVQYHQEGRRPLWQMRCSRTALSAVYHVYNYTFKWYGFHFSSTQLSANIT